MEETQTVTQQTRQEEASKETRMTENGTGVMEKLHDIEVAQATLTATTAGAQATMAATTAGGMATGAASMAGLASAVVAGAAGFVVGVFMGLAVAHSGHK